MNCEFHRKVCTLVCLAPGLCSNRVLCSKCVQEHAPEHFQYLEDFQGYLSLNTNTGTKIEELIKSYTVLESKQSGDSESGEKVFRGIMEKLRAEVNQILDKFENDLLKHINETISTKLPTYTNQIKELTECQKEIQGNEQVYTRGLVESTEVPKQDNFHAIIESTLKVMNLVDNIVSENPLEPNNSNPQGDKLNYPEFINDDSLTIPVADRLTEHLEVLGSGIHQAIKDKIAGIIFNRSPQKKGGPAASGKPQQGNKNQSATQKAASPAKEGETLKLDLPVKGSPTRQQTQSLAIEESKGDKKQTNYNGLSYVTTLNLHSKGVLNMLFLEGDKYLVTVSRDNTIKIIRCDWEKNKFQVVSTFTWETKDRRDYSPGPGGISSNNQSISVSREKTKDVQLTRGMCFNTASKRLIVGTTDGTMLVVDPKNTGEKPIILENAHFDSITDIVYAEEIHAFISCSTDFNVKAWDATRMICTKTFNIPGSSLLRLLYLPPQKCVAVCSFINDVILLSMENGALINSLVGHKDSVSCIYYHSTKKAVITAGLDSVINFWDVRSCACVKSIDQNIKRAVTHFDLMQTPVGLELLIGVDKDKNIKLWNAYSLDCISTIPKAHNDSITSIITLPSQSMVITSGEDHAVKFWRFE